MFGLFKKKPEGPQVTDKVVIDAVAKYTHLLEAWQQNNNLVFVCWFEKTMEDITAFMEAKHVNDFPVILARELRTARLSGRVVVFAEHYPIRSREEELWLSLDLDKVIIYSSLREPLFNRFGGDKIIQLMLQLGMKENELIEHKMISGAIKKAQDKIEQQITVEQSSSSQQGWIDNNYKS